MTELQLGTKLKEMYEISGENKTTMILLFGVLYADEIRLAHTNPAGVVKAAGMKPSYATEVSKGMNLSKFLTLKETFIDRF